MQNKNWLVYVQLGLGMAIFGSGTPVSKIVTDNFPVFLGSMLRMALGTAILAPFIWQSRTTLRKLERRDWLTLFGIALIGMLVFSVAMLYGMQMVSGVVGSIVMSTTPAITAVASLLFLNEKFGWRRGVAVALAVAGVLVVQLGSGGEGNGSNVLLGSLLIFVAVCAEASYTLLGKVASDDLQPTTVTGVAAGLAIILFLPLAAWQLRGFDASGVSWQGWAAVVWWGLGTLALGSTLWYQGVKQVEGSTAAGFMGIMPVSALVLSYVLLGEPFQWIHLAGFGLVFAGVVLISRAHMQEMADGETSDGQGDREARTTRQQSAGD